MTKKRICIKASSLPIRSPVGFAVMWWLLLDRLGAPGWAYGVLWTLVGILAAGFVYVWRATEYRDVDGFGNRKP